MLDSDIEIDDIVTNTVNKVIRVTWKTKNRYQHNFIANKPVTCTVRYKVIYLVLFILMHLMKHNISITINFFKYECVK